MELLSREAIRKMARRLHVHATAVPMPNTISGRVSGVPRVMEWHPTVAHRSSMDPGVLEYPVDDTDKANQNGYQAGARSDEGGLGCPFYPLPFTGREWVGENFERLVRLLNRRQEKNSGDVQGYGVVSFSGMIHIFIGRRT